MNRSFEAVAWRVRRMAIPALAVATLAACRPASLEVDDCPDSRPRYERFVAGKEFPYSAPAERRRQVIDGYPSVELGMSAEEVAARLGEPDWGGCHYAKEPPRELIGFSWTYSFRKLDAELVNELEDQGVMVFFDAAGRARWLVPQGVDGLDEKGRPGGPAG